MCKTPFSSIESLSNLKDIFKTLLNILLAYMMLGCAKAWRSDTEFSF